MTLTETTQTTSVDNGTPFFDAVSDDPTLDKPDLTWGEFVDQVSDWPARDGVKVLLVAIYATAKGQRGQRIDVDALVTTGRKKSTINQTLPVLAENGWVDRTPIQIPGKNRWTTGWVTTKFIQG